jgi:hypothetical protein
MKTLIVALCLTTTLAFAQTAPKRAQQTPATAAKYAPSAEQLAEIELLKIDVANVQKGIGAAEAEDQKLAGGLIKTRIQSRLEVMRTTLALLEQRIKALETGAKMTVVVPVTKPDPVLAASLEAEISSQLLKIEKARADSDKYNGGLIKARIDDTVAIMGETLALLENRALTAKYGLGLAPSPSASTTAISTGAGAIKPDAAKERPAPSPKDEIIKVQLLGKRFSKEKYESFIYFDLSFTAANLKKPSRAIKGTLNITDLFGEKIMGIGWTIDRPMTPGESASEYGTGFKYNQFRSEHAKVNQTDLANLKASFTVESVIYDDGTREDF